MTTKLSYPTAGAPTTEYDLGSFLETLPYSRPTRLHQTAFDTDGGDQLVYDWGSSLQAFNVTLYPLTQAQADNVVSFFTTTVNGREKTWELTDELGTVYSVRFAQDTIEAVMVTPTLYQVVLTLRVP